MSNPDAPEDAYISHGMIVYGDLSKGASLSKGFEVKPPDIGGSSSDYKAIVHDSLTRLLRGLDASERLQWQWRVAGDYNETLDAYDKATTVSTNSIAIERRQARSSTYRRAQENRKLRREYLTLYISIKVEASPSLFKTKSGLAQHYQTILEQYSSHFEQFRQRLMAALGSDIAIKPLDDLGLFTEFYRFLNPLIDASNNIDYAALFNPQYSVQELCCNSDVFAPDSGNNSNKLFFDGCYHAVLVLKRLGEHTYIGIVNALTSLPFLNYQISLSIVPRNKDRETKLEERAAEVLENEQVVKFRRTRKVSIDKKDAKIERLSKGHMQPYDMLFVVRVWAKDEASLATYTAAIRNAVHAMRGAETYQVTLPASTRKLFCATWPGNLWHSYGDRYLYIEDPNLADLIPFSASFTGLLKDAEALYEGPYNQLVGVKTFEDGTAQPMVVFGASRGGKSYFIADLLEQTAAEVGYTVIIEEGASHTEFTRRHNGRTLTIHPESPYTINYFDTGGVPLTRTHLSFAVALVAHMAGRIADARQQTARLAQITHYIQLIYDGQFEQWSKSHRDLLPRINREAYAVQQWHHGKMAADATALDAWLVIRDGLKSGDQEICQFVNSFSEDAILKFTKEPATARRCVQHAFAYFKPSDYPTHSQFAEQLLLNPSSEHPANEIREIGTNLQAWSRDEGTYGPLFDGVTNVDLGGRVLHFELSRIPNHQIELKSAVALLITSLVRQHIYSLPRAMHKQVILEEMARYIDIPDAEALVTELYAQMAKTGTWVCAIVQQFSQFKSSRACPIIMGNAKQFVIFRQMYPADLAEIAASIGLPEDMKHAVSTYPLPADLPEHDRYSACCYHIASRVPSITGTLLNRVPKPTALNK